MVPISALEPVPERSSDYRRQGEADDHGDELPGQRRGDQHSTIVQRARRRPLPSPARFSAASPGSDGPTLRFRNWAGARRFRAGARSSRRLANGSGRVEFRVFLVLAVIVIGFPRGRVVPITRPGARRRESRCGSDNKTGHGTDTLRAARPRLRARANPRGRSGGLSAGVAALGRAAGLVGVGYWALLGIGREVQVGPAAVFGRSVWGSPTGTPAGRRVRPLPLGFWCPVRPARSGAR